MKRLRELCARWDLPDGAERQLAALLRLLADDRAAPTSVRDPARALDIHLADSLSGLVVLRRRPAMETIVDIGSGAGFPGIPLAVALPVRIDLLEATRRKCAFLVRSVEALGLERARVVCERAEEWGSGPGCQAYDAALVRAVGPLPTLVEYAAPVLREGGLLVAWKGRRDPAAERAGERAAEALGLRSLPALAVEPFAGASRRHLHLYEKAAPTPAGYPRRSGVARKRPLGA